MNKREYAKWMKIILFIDKYTARDIGIITNTAISTIFKRLKWFQEKNWITIEKNGRKNKIRFTKKGKEIKTHCYEILKELNELKPEIKYKTKSFGDLYEKI